MSKMTLIEIVQKIHDALDFDEVNSINDIPDSMQVAQIVESTFFELANRKDWAHLKEVSQLEASGDNTKPSHMKVPEQVREVKNIMYNVRTSTDTKDKQQDMTYMTPDDFLRYVNRRDSSASNIDVISDFSGISLNIRNDVAPTYYTSFDDEYVVFDAYDSVLEATLQQSKSQLIGIRQPTFSLVDSHVADLPVEMFPLLLSEAMSTASFQLRQVSDAKAEQQAKRQYLRMARKNWTVEPQERYPNYGRKKNPKAWGR